MSVYGFRSSKLKLKINKKVGKSKFKLQLEFKQKMKLHEVLLISATISIGIIGWLWLSFKIWIYCESKPYICYPSTGISFAFISIAILVATAILYLDELGLILLPVISRRIFIGYANRVEK